MSDFKRGDLILYRDFGADCGVGRINLVRSNTLTIFPFLINNHRWAKVQSRLDRSRVIAQLPKGTTSAIAKRLTVMSNLRSAARAKAQARFQEQIDQLTAEFA